MKLVHSDEEIASNRKVCVGVFAELLKHFHAGLSSQSVACAIRASQSGQKSIAITLRSRVDSDA